MEAQRRRKSDRKALEQRNQHTLARWIEQHGDTNKKERLTAGLLPWQEGFLAIDNYYFDQLSHLVADGDDENKLPFYRRFAIEEVCSCKSDIDFDGSPIQNLCRPFFQTAEPEELSAGEWDNLSRIKKGLAEIWAGETYNVGLREHRAKCRSVKVPLVRRTALITVSLDELSFQREVLLTEVADDAIPF